GIRDFHVTGVQTCALPIFRASPMIRDDSPHGLRTGGDWDPRPRPSSSKGEPVRPDLMQVFAHFVPRAHARRCQGGPAGAAGPMGNPRTSPDPNCLHPCKELRLLSLPSAEASLNALRSLVDGRHSTGRSPPLRLEVPPSVPAPHRMAESGICVQSDLAGTADNGPGW